MIKDLPKRVLLTKKGDTQYFNYRGMSLAFADVSIQEKLILSTPPPNPFLIIQPDIYKRKIMIKLRKFLLCKK